MNDDPILDAKTVSALMTALNKVYKWKLPETFPPNTQLGELWAVPVKVRKAPKPGVLYLATGPYAVASILSGTVQAQVVSAT